MLHRFAVYYPHYGGSWRGGLLRLAVNLMNTTGSQWSASIQRAAAVVAVIILGLSVEPAAADSVVSGKVDGIVDGDTLIIDDARVRLWGVDAPESKQQCQRADGTLLACGADAASYLGRLIGTAHVVCTRRDVDRHKRIVGICRTSPQGVDLGLEMVRSGWAVDYTTYSAGWYRNAEYEARAIKAGMWAGRFDPPAAWRRARK